MVIHAMALRPVFYELVPKMGDLRWPTIALRVGVF